MRLNTDPNLDSPDAFYEALVAMHRGLTDDQSEIVNARLILVLANHIGDLEILGQAIQIARGSANSPRPEPTRKEAPR
ncbi:MAG: DUF2783 domain-containing protein [Gammaproteobacteria bacterium]|nr:DUF2783 domain-containing protein [Gammaproteobacteria bacterium]